MPERENDADVALLKMLPGMMPILHCSGVRTPGQFGPMRRSSTPESDLLTLILCPSPECLGDADDERDFSVDGFENGVGGEGAARRWRWRRRGWRERLATCHRRAGRVRVIIDVISARGAPTIWVP